MSAVLAKIKMWGGLVKFSHSVFALPFALSMYLIASRSVHPGFATLLWILAACVAARTAAMGFNRLQDAKLDALNPRTAGRELPAGKISMDSARVLVLASSAAFLGAAWLLGLHCLVLAPLVLAVLFFYSWTKRFTALSHLVLGLCLGLAPGGVWYALTARFAWEPVPLMLGVLFWVAGFDTIYACQDTEFDQRHGLHSIPARFGNRGALWLARLLHLAALAALAIFGVLAGLSVIYFCGLGIFGALIFSQHVIVSANDLSRVNEAFFVRNGLASVLFLLVVSLDMVLR